MIEYSKYNLTVISDRLPAISGLSRLFPQLGEYWAGMWSKEFRYPCCGERRVKKALEASPSSKVTLILRHLGLGLPLWTQSKGLSGIIRKCSQMFQMPSKIPRSSDTYHQIRDVHLVLKGPVYNRTLRYFNSSWFGARGLRISHAAKDCSR